MVVRTVRAHEGRAESGNSDTDNSSNNSSGINKLDDNNNRLDAVNANANGKVFSKYCNFSISLNMNDEIVFWVHTL